MTINLQDNFNNSLDLNDIILVHYPNQYIKYLGLLDFDAKNACFILSDNHANYQAFKPACATHIERIAKLSERGDLYKELGRYDKRKTVKNIMDKIFGSEKNPKPYLLFKTTL
jgi:hypothetical protein